MRLHQSEPAVTLPAQPERGFVSLASRLALVIFALVAAVSLMVAFELTRREREHYTESKRRAGEMLTELFAASLLPALDFSDAEAVSSSLRLLAQNKEVVVAVVWPADGANPLGRLQRRGDGVPELPRRTPGVRVSDEHIDITLGIKSPSGTALGDVAVRVSLARENTAFASARTGWGGVLAHLLRNAVAHGIEAPADRRALGKPETGRLEVSCTNGNGVIIAVADDGAGFDLDALFRAAKGNGETQGIELAFISGITTRDTPDELAGHGVGLSAVRDDLAQAGYIVRTASERSKGARLTLVPRARRKEADNG